MWPRVEILRYINSKYFHYCVTNNSAAPALVKYAKIKDSSNYIERWSDVKKFKGIRQSHIGHRTLSPQDTLHHFPINQRMLNFL